jgi:thymidylate kinase
MEIQGPRQPPCVTYVALEGIDGSGKSTVANMVAERLCVGRSRAVRFSYLGRRDHTLGRFLQRTFHSPRLPFHAHLLNALPALKMILYQHNAFMNWRSIVVAGPPWSRSMDRLFVVGDRSIASLLINFDRAFGGRRASERAIRLLNKLPVPSDVVYLDVSPEVALGRLLRRGAALEANETAAELACSRATYEEVLFGRPLWFAPRVHRLDGSLPIDDVAADVTTIASNVARGG